MSLDLDNMSKKLLDLGKGLVGVLLGMLAFLLVVVPVFLIRSCEMDQGTDEARRLERLEILEDVSVQYEELQKLDFIDQEAGVVHLPIDNAMAATIVDLKNKEVKDSGISAANWAPPQLPAWADAPPLYTLTIPEQQQEQINAQAEATADGTPDPEPADAAADTETEPDAGTEAESAAESDPGAAPETSPEATDASEPEASTETDPETAAEAEPGEQSQDQAGEQSDADTPDESAPAVDDSAPEVSAE